MPIPELGSGFGAAHPAPGAVSHRCQVGDRPGSAKNEARGPAAAEHDRELVQSRGSGTLAMQEASGMR